VPRGNDMMIGFRNDPAMVNKKASPNGEAFDSALVSGFG
jgi:hypothetical protein